MKKRIMMTVATMTLSMFGLYGCSSKSSLNAEVNNEEKIQIVCTTYPQYDWAKQVIGEEKDRFELVYLLENGVDIHSYQPTAKDIAAIADSDLVIYIGGTSDTWVKDAVEQSNNDQIKTISLFEVLGDSVKEEEIIEGMQDDHSHEEDEHTHEEDGHSHEEYGHSHEEYGHNHEEDGHNHEEDGHNHEEDEHTNEEIEYDEHVWLSLKHAKTFVTEIEKALETVDSENASVYQENCDNYVEQLEHLDKQYEEMVESAKRSTVLFADRFPFRYLVDDYGLNYYAAFPGCSADTEASFETIIFLAEKLKEENLPVVFVLENSDTKIADTVINNTKEKNQQILTINSIQSISSREIEDGFSYLSAMEKNLEVLNQALN